MKKHLLVLSTLITCGLNAQQIGNSDMELWENVGSSTEEPTNWNSFMTAEGGLTWAAAQQCQRSSITRPGSTGTYSARVYSRSAAFGIVANGNLTLGRIYMGSSTATSSSNYNFTKQSDPLFNEPFTGSPDSLVFWVRYTGASQARVSAILHNNYDYRDGYNVDANSTPHKVAEISQNFSTPSGQWMRMSFPWVYTGPASANTYILMTFTTNFYPGGGAATDEILVDDVELIYNSQMTATDDAVTTLQDTPIDITVANNDSDPETNIDVTSVTIVTGPTNGTANVNATTGVVTYTPNAGYFGSDSFTYGICDNGVVSTCDQAVVTITVNQTGGGNNQIVANDDNIVTDQNTPVITDVTANDVDFEGMIDLATLSVILQPANGITSVNNLTGEITYTPDAGYVGSDSYTYEICDAGTPATCDQALVSITVNSTGGVNEIEAQAFSYKMDANSLSIVNPSNIEGSVVVIDANGKIISKGSINDTFNVGQLNGVFFVKITTASIEQTIKIVRY